MTAAIKAVREELERNLASKIEPRVVADILNAYEGLIRKHRALDAEALHSCR